MTGQLKREQLSLWVYQDIRVLDCLRTGPLQLIHPSTASIALGAVEASIGRQWPRSQRKYPNHSCCYEAREMRPACFGPFSIYCKTAPGRKSCTR